jgi:hypothetical protein
MSWGNNPPPVICLHRQRGHGTSALTRRAWWFLRRGRVLVALAIGLAVLIAGVTFLMEGRIRVLDGDTVRYQSRTVRLVGFDTPETGDRARCEHERTLGARATSRLRELVTTRSADLTLVPCACPPGTEGTRSCNFGRACGVLTVDGRDVGGILILEGLAKPFRCSGVSCPRRASWCS